jgi:hypothetical protein
MGLMLSVLIALAKQPIHTHPRSDHQITQEIIQESIHHYYGNCLCPYSDARNAVSVAEGVPIHARGRRSGLPPF